MPATVPHALDFLPVSARRLGRLTVQQYHRMIETGVLTESHPVELLEGLLVTKMPHSPAHDCTIGEINQSLQPLIGSEWITRVQCSITTKDSEPELDLTVVIAPGRRYANRHPGPRDIGLVIEVAYATLEEDRQLKGRIYARANIPVYWIANLEDGLIEVYTEPNAGKKPAYRQRKDYSLNEKIPLVLAGIELDVLPVKQLLVMPTGE